MKKFKFKSMKSYIGAKCRQEGGKSEAKIHDALQIANLIADDLFDGDTLSIQTRLAWSKFKPTNIFSLFMKTGARRYLKRMKKEKAARTKKLKERLPPGPFQGVEVKKGKKK